MTRFAISILLTSLLTMGCSKTPSVAQVTAQASPQSTAPAEQQAQTPEIASSASSGQDAKLMPDTLKAEIEALKPAQLAWREIQWKTCLLEGLKEAREKKKPILLWVVGPGEALDGRV